MANRWDNIETAARAICAREVPALIDRFWRPVAAELAAGLRDENRCLIPHSFAAGITAWEAWLDDERQATLSAAASGEERFGHDYLLAAGHGDDDNGALFRPIRNNRTGDLESTLTPDGAYRLGRVDGFDEGFDQYYPAREADERAEGDVGFLAT